jgi:hypothetical protein|tara:strand:+ start:41994 stop:42683 length:690 start_codon:yes stop_codon:yes gene_type:complete
VSLFNLAGKYKRLWTKADEALGGILPGGGVPVKSEILNKLDPNVNLAYRYMTGMGIDDLELSPEFKQGAVNLAISPGPETTYINLDGSIAYKERANKTPGEIQPGETRAVNSYRAAGMLAPYWDTLGGPFGGVRPLDREREAAPYRYSLGRYNVTGNPDSYTVTDTYDFINEFENPELSTPGRKPWRALGETVAGFMDPSRFVRAYLYSRDQPPKPIPLEFTVPREKRP